MFLVQGRGVMAILPAVPEFLLHHIVKDTWTGCSVISTGLSANGGSACSYCNTLTSLCYGYIERLQCY